MLKTIWKLKNDRVRAALLGTVVGAVIFSIPPILDSQVPSPLTIQTSTGNVGIGTTGPVSKLQVGGDVALQAMAGGAGRVLPAGGTLIWNDGGWLRLNQNTDYSKPVFGVTTPGLFAPASLNVGGAGSWGDPGYGNLWITGSVGIGTTAPQYTLDVSGGDIRTSGTYRVGGAQGATVSMRVGPPPCEQDSITSLEITGGIITGYGVSQGGTCE